MDQAAIQTAITDKPAFRTNIGAMANTNAAVNAAIEDDPAATRAAAEVKRQANGGLTNYRAALNAGVRPSILAIGDSMVGTAFESIRKTVTSEFGLRGEGFVDAAADVAVTVNTADVARWITGITYDIENGEMVTFGRNTISPIEGNTLKVYYVQQPGGGVFKIQSQVEGGSWTDESGYTAIDTNGATAGIVITITKTEYRKRWMLRVVGVSDTSTIIGAGIRDTQLGGALLTLLPNASNGANNINHALACPPAILDPIMADIAPNLILLSHLDGAAIVNSSQAAYQDLLIDAVTSSAAADPSFVVIGPPPGINDVADASNAAQASAQESLAITRGDEFYDNRKWALPRSLAESRGLMVPGDVHFTEKASLEWVPRMVSDLGIGNSSKTGGVAQNLFSPSGGGVIRAYKASFGSDVYPGIEVLGSLYLVKSPYSSSNGVLYLEDTAGATSNLDYATLSYTSNNIRLIPAAGAGGSISINAGIGTGVSFNDPASTAGTPLGNLGSTTGPWRSIALGKSEASAAGDRTIATAHGTVKFALGSSTPIVVTHSLATATSNVMVTVYGTDATLTSCRVTRAAGSFTITPNAAATAETTVGWFVLP
jgi:hypothetical protein